MLTSEYCRGFLELVSLLLLSGFLAFIGRMFVNWNDFCGDLLLGFCALILVTCGWTGGGVDTIVDDSAIRCGTGEGLLERFS